MEQSDEIVFDINGKIRKIELCFGDITKLSTKEKKTDLLLVSAFPNNYAPVEGTLIGALYNNLGLSVHQLSKDKGEDLRSNFNCWISKELKDHFPFKKILCFEQDFKRIKTYGIYESNVNVVGDVFRALFTTYQKNDWSLITPILATGNQRANKVQMLRSMIKACAAWIRAGMPLSSMKIVIFKSNIKSPNAKDDVEAIDEFKRLKAEMNCLKMSMDKLKINNDVLFIYPNENTEEISLFVDSFVSLTNNQMKFKKLGMDNETGKLNILDMYDIYEDMMLQCTKVAIFLTKNFLDNHNSIEMFNLALCLANKIQRNILIPICLYKLDNLPEYMSLSQWIDCRLKSTNLKLEEVVTNGVKSLLNIIQSDSQKELKDVECSDNSKYDIFISYSHKDSLYAKVLLFYLTRHMPDKKIFFDKSEIKIGYAWQETLYSAISNTKIFIALLSEHYFASSVCQEEYSIAYSQHHSALFDTTVLPVWIDKKNYDQINESVSIKKMYSQLPIIMPDLSKIDQKSLSENAYIISLCHRLYNEFLKKTNSQMKLFEEKNVDYAIETASKKARNNFFNSNWSFKNGKLESQTVQKVSSNEIRSNSNEIDIVIVFSNDDSISAQYLKDLILKMNKDIKIAFSSISGQGDIKGIKNLESSYLILLLLNPYFVTENSCMLQLQIALSLQRRNNFKLGTLICPIVLETLPNMPSYLQLLPIRFNLNDEIYNKLVAQNYKMKIPTVSKKGISTRHEILFQCVVRWIINLFENNGFRNHQLPVIYSTFDLNHFGFEISEAANIKDFKEILLSVTTNDISKTEKDLNAFLDIYDTMESSLNYESISNPNFNFAETKSCLLM